MTLPPANEAQVKAEQKKVTKLLKQNRRREALAYLLDICRQGSVNELFEKILIEEFSLPYAGQRKACYAKNQRIFEAYPYFKPVLNQDLSGFDFLLLQCDEEYYKYQLTDKQSKRILFPHPRDSMETGTESGKVVFLKNYFHFKKIIRMEIENRAEDPDFPWVKIPFYLYYEEGAEALLPYLQLYDFSLLLKNERVVFLLTREELYDWFSNPQSVFPDIYPGLGEGDDIQKEISAFEEERNEEYRINLRKTHEYYAGLSKEYFLESLRSGKPRIIFFTSLMSTAAQYFIRDLAKACDRLQIPNHLIIEQDNILRVNTGVIFKLMNELHPDIFFIINDFRYQRPFIPLNMLYFNWAMDPYERMSYDSAEKTSDLDFILDLWISNKQSLLSRGHPEERIIEGPIIVPDAELYREYELSYEEQNEYGCDICLFSNVGNPGIGLESFLALIKEVPNYVAMEKLFTDAYEDLYRRFKNEDWIYSDEEYREFLDHYYKKFGLEIPENDREVLMDKFRGLVGWLIMRSLPVEWLHEKGYDMKLWGRDWISHPILSQYAQGVAENGEKLAKVIKAAKIVLGTSPGASVHPRVFETFLSGGFYLGLNIPVEHDYANIRKYMEEDKEIVFFSGKEDLYRKVDYYLENEAQRKEIIKNAQKKIKGEINYETLFPKVLEEVAQKLARQIEKEQENEVNQI